MDDGLNFLKSQLDLRLEKEERLAISPSVYQSLVQTTQESCNYYDRNDQINRIILTGQETELGISIIGLSAAIFDRVVCATNVKTKFVLILRF